MGETFRRGEAGPGRVENLAGRKHRQVVEGLTRRHLFGLVAAFVLSVPDFRHEAFVAY